MVRAAAFRRNALSLEQAFSIKVKSGEYGGWVAPASSMVGRTLAPSAEPPRGGTYPLSTQRQQGGNADRWTVAYPWILASYPACMVSNISSASGNT